MSENLALWERVEKTDPKHTKAITGKTYQGTSPKPHYLIHKATETFGPCGIGWGFQIVDERIEDGAGGERMSIARVKVWYKWGGERGEVEHIGGTSFSGIRASGKSFTDEDAPKKSVTDALIKALSMIGFAGDIFMGRYDDSKYVAELRTEAAAKAVQAPKPKTVAELKAAYEKLKSELATEQAKGWRNLQGWLKDQSVLADIEALERYTDDFKREAREVFDLAKAAEQEFGEPVSVTTTYKAPSFDHLQAALGNEPE